MTKAEMRWAELVTDIIACLSIDGVAPQGFTDEIRALFAALRHEAEQEDATADTAALALRGLRP